MKRKTIVDIVTLLTLSLFIYATIAKIMDYTLFKEQLTESPVLKPVAIPMAIGLPIVEFALVVLLAVPKWRLKGLYTSAGLLAIFTIYIVVVMTTSDRLPCSCGGLLEQMSWKGHIIFNISFIFIDLLAIRLERTIKKQAKQALSASFV